MWVLGSSITSTKTLVPGDNIKPFIYPVKTKSTTEFLKSKNSLATQFTYLNSKLDLKIHYNLRKLKLLKIRQKMKFGLYQKINAIFSVSMTLN